MIGVTDEFIVRPGQTHGSRQAVRYGLCARRVRGGPSTETQACRVLPAPGCVKYTRNVAKSTEPLTADIFPRQGY